MLKSVNSFGDPLGQKGFGRFTKECLSCLVQVVFVNVNTERHEKKYKNNVVSKRYFGLNFSRDLFGILFWNINALVRLYKDSCNTSMPVEFVPRTVTNLRNCVTKTVTQRDLVLGSFSVSFQDGGWSRKKTDWETSTGEVTQPYSLGIVLHWVDTIAFWEERLAIKIKVAGEQFSALPERVI